MAWLTHIKIRSSEIGDSLARERMDLRTLIASRKGVRYAIAMLLLMLCGGAFYAFAVEEKRADWRIRRCRCAEDWLNDVREWTEEGKRGSTEEYLSILLRGEHEWGMEITALKGELSPAKEEDKATQYIFFPPVIVKLSTAVGWNPSEAMGKWQRGGIKNNSRFT
jgi:hypothetical protein